MPLMGMLGGEKQDVCVEANFLSSSMKSAALRRGLSVLHRFKLGLT